MWLLVIVGIGIWNLELELIENSINERRNLVRVRSRCERE
jgi:hypothetical protein